jgi:hypothetical protein
VLAHFEPSCVLLGYYVKESEMGNRGGRAWQDYRAALKRLGLPDHFNCGAYHRGSERFFLIRRV